MREIVQSSDLSIVLAGEAGQGIQLIESVITTLSVKAGYHVFATKEYMSRVRGGVNSTSLRISSRPVTSFVNRIDILIPLSLQGIRHLTSRMDNHTVIIADDSITDEREIIHVSFNSIAREIGNQIYSNTVAAGLITALLSIDPAMTEDFIGSIFDKKGDAIRNNNILAVRRGYDMAKKIAITVPQIGKGNESDRITLSGADAVALGALAGGCDYVCGYPMSPSTGVLERMAKYSLSHDIIVEQVEDEIGVVNMALGAWYAGGRALVTTSGGGFALMCEGISLAGMIETPLVIHLAQRPGPATGLPTRTEQGDLNLALYAGHGDFPRIILAPGTLEDGFTLTRRAFELSDTFQVPVFILTDQYYVDTYHDTERFEVPSHAPVKSIIETGPDYKRFAYTDTGISPRGIPGFGSGIVCVDSDEHDEGGYIIEDAATRINMTDKRLKKNTRILEEAGKPRIIGNPRAGIMIVAWGSTFNITRDAVLSIGNDDIALVHFTWLFPLPDTTAKIFASANKIISVENNASGHFADLLSKATGLRITERILKYDGRPFSVEELTTAISARCMEDPA